MSTPTARERDAAAAMPHERGAAPLLFDKPLILIPAKDEAATVGAVVAEVRRELACDVVVIDDASIDATISVARSAGATVLPLSVHLGAWGAVQTGIRYALAAGYSSVVTMDADGQHPASAASALLPPILSGRSHVVVGSHPERGSPARQLAWRFFRRITGLSVEDLTSGFRAYDRRALSILASREATLMDYQDIGVLVLLRSLGLRIAEVRVPMRSRVQGKSRVFSSWFAVGAYLLHTGVLCLSKWQPNANARAHLGGNKEGEAP